MKISREKLRRLIAESNSRRLIEQEDKKYFGFEEVSGQPKALKMKVDLGGPTRDVFTKLAKALNADLDEDNYYLFKGYYDKYMSKGKPGIFGATGKSLGISKDGDPYTYEPLGGGKYRVISGPKANAVGKTFTAKSKGTTAVASREPGFIIVKDYNDFASKIRNQSKKYGLDKNFSTTTENKVIREPAAKDAVKESEAGNIGVSDVKDALVEVARGMGVEVVETAYASIAGRQPVDAAGGTFVVYIAYKRKDRPNIIIIEQTAEFTTPSGGEDARVSPGTESQSTSRQLSESRGNLYRHGYHGRY